jgi:predicted nucleic acid-binding protein
VAVKHFLDTSVLVGGLIHLGPQSAAAQSLMHAVAEGTVGSAATAWQCCLEFFSVATRLPAEFRLTPADAAMLVEQEVFGRLEVVDLPARERAAMLRHAGQEGIAGGRIYDTHIAEVARAASASVIVTDNRRHFLAALRHGIRVETPREFLASLKQRPSARPESG